ncbi:MAG: N-acetylmuramoyl-L-alanine amidase [Spirochaetales bacterium]|nr:N-acetylmuramoyl-L-alanine amidase [Spirochaetales bacterium]
MLFYRSYFIFTLGNGNKRWADFSKNKTDIGVYSVASYFFDDFITKQSQDVKKKLFSGFSHLSDKGAFSDKCLKASEEHDEWNWGDVYKGLLQSGESCCVCIPGYYHIVRKKNRENTSYPSAWRVTRDLSKEESKISQGIPLADYATVVKDLFMVRYGVAPEDYKGGVVEYFLPGAEIKKIVTKEKKTEEKKEESGTAEVKTEENKTEGTPTDGTDYYIVTIDGLNVRMSDSSGGKSFLKLNKGVIVEYIKTGKAEVIQGHNGTWINIRVSKGVEGWCYDRFLKKVDSKKNFIVLDGGKKKIKNVIVFLNPGHRNTKFDYGCVGFTDDWKTFAVKNMKERDGFYDTKIKREASVVLQIALKLKSQLEADNYSVEITRTTSSEVKSLDNVCQFVNKKLTDNSVKSKVAVFISLHTNSAAKKTLTKDELKKVRAKKIDGYYYYTFEDGTSSTIPVPDTTKSGGLIYMQKTVKNTKGDTILYKAHPKSIILQENIASELGGLKPGCVKKEANFKVLRDTREIPGVLLELGFMTNPDELNFLIKEENQKSICSKIVAGLNRCFK